MKIQQLIEEQIKQLDSRIQSIIFYTQDINKDEIVANELYKSHFETVRESTRSFARKLIEAVGEELINTKFKCGWKHDEEGVEYDLCDECRAVEEHKDEQRLKLKEIISSLK